MQSLGVSREEVIWPVCAYFVLRAEPPTCGRSKSTPNGAFLSVRKDLSSAICSRSMSGVYPTPPITPRPPAFVTAAASLGPAATFIPARRTGWGILRRSVTVVRSCSAILMSVCGVFWLACDCIDCLERTWGGHLDGLWVIRIRVIEVITINKERVSSY